MQSRDPLKKAFDCLTHMVESGEDSWSVRQLAGEFELPVSTVHRTVTALCDVGMLRQNEETQLYELGEGLHRLARRAVSAFPLPEIARPHLEVLVQETGETALLGVQDVGHSRMMFYLQVEGTHSLRYVVPLYTWVPLHLGASGLGILAFLDEPEQQRILKELENDPDVALEELREQISTVRSQGFAISRGQRIAGAVGVAAPIFGPDQHVAADVLLTIPEGRFEAAEEGRYVDLVRKCAERVTTVLGG